MSTGKHQLLDLLLKVERVRQSLTVKMVSATFDVVHLRLRRPAMQSTVALTVCKKHDGSN